MKGTVCFAILAIVLLVLVGCSTDIQNIEEGQRVSDEDIASVERWIKDTEGFLLAYLDEESDYVTDFQHSDDGMDLEGNVDPQDDGWAQLKQKQAKPSSLPNNKNNDPSGSKGQDSQLGIVPWQGNRTPTTRQPSVGGKKPAGDTGRELSPDKQKSPDKKIDDKDTNQNRDGDKIDSDMPSAPSKKQYINNIDIKHNDLLTDISVWTIPEVYSVQIDNKEMHYNGRNRYNLSIAGLKKDSNVNINMYDKDGKLLHSQKCVIN